MADSPHRHLPRLPVENYRGYQFVHWTMTISDRRREWLNEQFHLSFRETISQAALRYHVVVPAYCLMPDHMHILAAGVSAASDQKLWARAIRRTINHALKPFRLQRQAYDHVLRTEEKEADALPPLLHYVCENPVRAGLVANAQDWPFSGSIVPALPDLKPYSSEFHERWWIWWNRLPA